MTGPPSRRAGPPSTMTGPPSKKSSITMQSTCRPIPNVSGNHPSSVVLDDPVTMIDRWYSCRAARPDDLKIKVMRLLPLSYGWMVVFCHTDAINSLVDRPRYSICRQTTFPWYISCIKIGKFPPKWLSFGSDIRAPLKKCFRPGPRYTVCMSELIMSCGLWVKIEWNLTPHLCQIFSFGIEHYKTRP